MLFQGLRYDLKEEVIKRERKEKTEKKKYLKSAKGIMEEEIKERLIEEKLIPNLKIVSVTDEEKERLAKYFASEKEDTLKMKQNANQ